MPCGTSWDVEISKGECFFVYYATLGWGTAREKEPIEKHDKLTYGNASHVWICSCRLVTYCRYVHRVGEVPYRVLPTGFHFSLWCKDGYVPRASRRIL